jgi:3',5'-cyclic AMP phosphodiesterase CpdA
MFLFEFEGICMKTTFKIVTLSLITSLIIVFQGCAQQTTLPLGKIEKERPVALPEGTAPERIILTWDSDPAATQAVTWRTEKSCANSFAQIALAVPDPNFGKKAASVTSTNQTVKRENDSLVYYHTVSFHNLSPSTLYAYRVGDGVAFSEWNQFKTADTQPKPFKFIYLGDAQNDIKMRCSRVIRQAFIDAPDAAFIIHAGDLVSTADSDEQWDEWFETAGWVYRTIPSIPIIGNHEQPNIDANDKEHTGISLFWRPQFALPLNGPEGLLETVYYLDYQGVRFIALNGTKLLDEQSKWLEPVLADNPNRWTIVVMHQPMFSTGKDRDSKEIQAAFENLFDKYKVDLVLQGHDHTYARTHKVFAAGIVADDRPGTVYCTSVVGPKQYSFNPRYARLMSKTGSDTQLFQIISIENGTLSYKSITAANTMYDSFEIRKTADSSTTLIEP